MTCRAEGPELERFAREQKTRVDVIGLGAGGGVDDGRDFQREVRVGAPLRMVFDATRDSWKALGVAYQPAAILFDGTGRELRRWIGPLDPDELEDALPRA